MNKIKKEWLHKTILERILLILSFIISIIILVLSFLNLFNVIDNVTNYYIILIATLMIIQGINNIKRDKISCIVYFTIGLFILTLLLIKLLY